MQRNVTHSDRALTMVELVIAISILAFTLGGVVRFGI